MGRFDEPFDFLPRGWRDQTVYTFVGPVVDGLEHVLRLSIDRPLPSGGTSPSGFVAMKTESVLSAYTGVSVMTAGPVRLGRLAAHELTFQWSPAPKLSRVVQHYFVFTPNAGLTFHCMYTEESFVAVREDVQSNITALLA